MEKVSSKLIRGAIYDNIKQLKDQKIIALTTGAWSKFEGDVDVYGTINQKEGLLSSLNLIN